MRPTGKRSEAAGQGRSWRAAFLVAAALLTAAPAMAEGPAGEFRGALEDRGRPVPVILQLEAGRQPGGPGGRILFREPWVCGFELEYSGSSDGAETYSVRGAGAGSCRAFTQGFVQVQAVEGALNLGLLGASGSAGPSAQLLAPGVSGGLPAGEYRGVMEDRGRPVLVILQLEAGIRIGEFGGRLRFQEPWACGFDLEYSGSRGREEIYSFRGAGAGPCRSLTQGYARLQMTDDSISLETVADSGGGQRIRFQPARR